jgi:putative membrane protein
MPPRSSHANGHLLKHVVAGVTAGLAGAWAMNCFQNMLSKASSRSNGVAGQHEQQEQDEPTDVKTADAIAVAITGHPVPKEEKAVAGAAVHYAFGGAVGAMYGAAASHTDDVSAWAGLPFGATVWLVADEMGVPLSGLSKGPFEYPLATHANALAAHLVYGITTEMVRRLVLRVL